MTDTPEIRSELPAAATTRGEAKGTETAAAAVVATDRYTVVLPHSRRVVKLRQIDGDTATVVESLMVDAGYKGNSALLRCLAAASIASIDGSHETPPETVNELKAVLKSIHRVDWEPLMLRTAALDGLAEDPALGADFRDTP